VIHLRVVSPSDITSTLVPELRAELAVMNLTLLSAAATNPDGDAVHFFTAVAILGLTAQRALWQRATRRSATAPPD